MAPGHGMVAAMAAAAGELDRCLLGVVGWQPLRGEEEDVVSSPLFLFV